MSCFNVHFFNEVPKDSVGTNINANEIIEYLELRGIFRITSDESKVVIYYDHPRLPYSSRIVMTKGSILNNLYRLNPAFRDVKMHVEIDVNIPEYVAREFLEIAENLASRFSFKTYNEFLEDVGDFNLEQYLSIFSAFKGAYIDKNPSFSERFIKVNVNKMDAILRYMDEKLNLENFFKEELCVVPRYQFLKTDDKKLKLAINWVENTATIFPPFVDYVYYTTDNLIYLYDLNEIIQYIEPYVESVPGFIKEARLVSVSNIKKITKAIKKARLRPLVKQFRSSELNEIIDY